MLSDVFVNLIHIVIFTSGRCFHQSNFLKTRDCAIDVDKEQMKVQIHLTVHGCQQNNKKNCVEEFDLYHVHDEWEKMML